jgi:hypothetical protein
MRTSQNSIAWIWRTSGASSSAEKKSGLPERQVVEEQAYSADVTSRPLAVP